MRGAGLIGGMVAMLAAGGGAAQAPVAPAASARTASDIVVTGQRARPSGWRRRRRSM